MARITTGIAYTQPVNGTTTAKLHLLMLCGGGVEDLFDLKKHGLHLSVAFGFHVCFRLHPLLLEFLWRGWKGSSDKCRQESVA